GLARDLDEAVGGERGHRSLVQPRERPRRRGHELERPRPALPERALERALLSKRLVATTARGAGLCERADPAAGDAGEADLAAEVEERLRALVVEGEAGPL